MLSAKKPFTLVIFLSVSACASHQDKHGLFDSPSHNEVAAKDVMPEQSAKRPASFKKLEEPPKYFAAADVLSVPLRSENYTISEAAPSNGRYLTFAIKTEDGAYTVQGKQFMEDHVHELNALAALREKNKAVAFARSAGTAVITPIKSVYTTVTAPVTAAKNVYGNAKGMVKSVRKGVGKAATFVKTRGNMPPETAEREEDGFISGFFGRPEAIRKLAFEMKVDPYTHFTPLRDELTELANYHAAGQFGVDQGLSFVPGVGSIIISSLKTADSLTRKTLLKTPDEMADINRERLAEAGISKESTEGVLLNAHFTPTEKTIFTGLVIEAKDLEGIEVLMMHASGAQSRPQAFSALMLVEMLGRLHDDSKIEKVEVHHDVVVAYQADSTANIVLPYDYLSWTSYNAKTVWNVTRSLAAKDVKTRNVRFVLAGDLSENSRKALETRKWGVRRNLMADVL
ncbi:hypothetical protein PsAD13_02262 [Pseudovibrio sp. Ad13]|uniref:hypothetical protein n=1 Tax=Pseudovibrio sp. Ad13 TaxID=989396 RepID=UPI0007AEB37C|nr:hypothetical protein [Pseudovibrio sp. Ad13]KZK84797.1 hypothetical protein PsAD13_02262 [Pseudovibrio sp. Ad13]